MSMFPSIVSSPSFLMIPIAVAVAFALLMIPSLLVPGAKVEGVAKAISCTMVKAFGLVLMAISAVTVLRELISMEFGESEVMSALLLLFVIGLGLLIYESSVLETVDHASSEVVTLIFNHTCIIVGQVIVVLSVISIAFSILFLDTAVSWDLSLTLLLLGLLLMLTFGVHVNEKARGKKKK